MPPISGEIGETDTSHNGIAAIKDHNRSAGETLADQVLSRRTPKIRQFGVLQFDGALASVTGSAENEERRRVRNTEAQRKQRKANRTKQGFLLGEVFQSLFPLCF
ncbi:MAG: hypothetical protein JWP89_1790 [Schlesneria sp.]|nr:hypothetical protein [Schlesneria sp.]